jgi:NADPH-dependent curcumin reductase CurA
MEPVVSREVRLASFVNGWPTADNFHLARVEVPAPAEGQVLVRNMYFSLDPYMRGRMNEGWSWRNLLLGPMNKDWTYLPTFRVGQPLDGAAIGEVVSSRDARLRPGTIVMSSNGWREYFVADAGQVQAIDRPIRPLTAHLGVLGTTGLTAWIGLKLGGLKKGDRVFVSSAAGAVGSIACQLAKLAGGFVVGSTGSERKRRMLIDNLGLDAAVNYTNGSLLEQLNEAAPGGIDLYFDNVGGDHLEAALAAMRLHGRVVVSGSISQYNTDTSAPGPRNLFLIVVKGITIYGFRANDYPEETRPFEENVRRYLDEGTLKTFETFVDGIEAAPQGFLDMLHGGNVGKMIVRLAID